MTPLQNLYYATGELAYAIACADGEVQKAERQKFHDIVAEELSSEQFGFDISLIIFQVMDKTNTSSAQAYETAMEQLRSNSQYLNLALKDKFIKVMEKAAEAFPPVTMEENEFIEKLKSDLTLLHTDKTQ
jgi:DnaJ-domain-containing protein 1